MIENLYLQLEYAKTMLKIYEQEEELNIEAINHYRDMLSMVEKEIKDTYEINK